MKTLSTLMTRTLFVAGALMTTVPMVQAETMQHDMSKMTMPMAANQYPLNGTVVSIDEANKQVTLSHDAVKELNWPAMTMPFSVADVSLLKGLKSGQHIMAMFTTKEGQSPTIVSLHTM